MGAIIAIDAMGGDDAPGPEVAGAAAAVREGAQVLLLGDEPRLRQELARQQADQLGITVRHCSEVITMHDAPGHAVRHKRDSSMRVAFELLRRGEVQAVVSAGNSGAMLACGLLCLGRVRGVDRPGIIVTFPTLDPARSDTGGYGECALLDMGANVDVKASNLAQFAVLGATFARHSLNRQRPRVGLLANGEEATKGTETLREAHALLSRPGLSDLEFVGFVEGRDIFEFQRAGSLGGLDVVITDGFTGNVVLKTAEGAAHFLTTIFKRAVKRSWLSRLGGLLMLPSLRASRELIDVERRGGALLLGVAGVVVICHGRTTPRAVASAVALARRQIDSGLIAALDGAIARNSGLWSDIEADDREARSAAVKEEDA